MSLSFVILIAAVHFAVVFFAICFIILSVFVVIVFGNWLLLPVIIADALSVCSDIISLIIIKPSGALYRLGRVSCDFVLFRSVESETFLSKYHIMNS